MGTYRKKPVEVEAIQYTGDNLPEMGEFIDVESLNTAQPDGDADYFYIKTLEGNMRVSKGDYVIQGVQGEFYPCKPDIFEETYEEVETFTETPMDAKEVDIFLNGDDKSKIILPGGGEMGKE